MGRLGSAIEVVNQIGSFFYGSILGVFVLAIGTRRATGRGAFWGLGAGMLAVAVTSRVSTISYLYYNIVGCVVVVLVGYLISLTSREPSAEPTDK
jgi:Na+/proline symporter